MTPTNSLAEAVKRATLYTKGNEESPYARFEEMAADLETILSALSAREAALKDARVAAYEAGATAVHEWWSAGNVESEPDFTEAAQDYAAAQALGDRT